MNKSFDELHENMGFFEYATLTSHSIVKRIEVMDLRGMNEVHFIQQANTYNFLRKHRENSTSHDWSNIVPLVLHINLGIVNKFVYAFDAVITIWEERRSWMKSDDCPVSPEKSHLSRALSNIG